MKFVHTTTHTIEVTEEQIDALIERYDLKDLYEDENPDRYEMIGDLFMDMLPYDALDLVEMGIYPESDTTCKMVGADEQPPKGEKL